MERKKGCFYENVNSISDTHSSTDGAMLVCACVLVPERAYRFDQTEIMCTCAVYTRGVSDMVFHVDI